MSFILDALKKSETDRQQAGSAEFAGVPASSGNQRAPRWLWILGVLLVINLAVLLGLLLRREVNPVPAAAIKIARNRACQPPIRYPPPRKPARLP